MTFQNAVLRDVYHHFALFKIPEPFTLQDAGMGSSDVGQVVGKEVILTALVTLLSWDSPVGQPCGKASWDRLEGKP